MEEDVEEPEESTSTAPLQLGKGKRKKIPRVILTQ